MKLYAKDIAQLLDASALKMETSYSDFQALVDGCKKYGFGCAFIWNSFSKELGEALRGTSTEFGTSLAFPIGQDTTEFKVAQAEYFVKLGAQQVDMVMNIGLLRSKMYDRVAEDIAAVRKATKDTSLKVIIEAMILSDEEIVKACEIVRDCGCDYVKSGTGFAATPTTMHHVALMKKTVGDKCKVKAAGGVRDLQTLLNMYAIGVDRFGVNLANSIKITEEAAKYADGIEVPTLRLEDYL